jgi:mRNA interferase RelE/StbE
MVSYKIEFTNSAKENFKKLDNSVKRAIIKYLERYNLCCNPRAFGKPLKYSLYGLWRYRVGNYRIIADIEDDKLIILILEIDHRGKIYG